MKVSINNLSGALIEMQSHGNDEVMIANATTQGFTDVIVKEVTEDEFKELLKASDLINETTEQTITRLEGVLDRHLDATANLYRYESIRTMVTYATSTHPIFGVEGRAAVAYRDAVYAYGIQCIADVTNGLRSIPTEEQLISELPLFIDYLV
jgi:hypothetical protein